MPYKLIRRDLTETTRVCDFCPNHLTSLKAYVLKDLITDELFYAGPTCAKNNTGGNSLSGIPDLTKFTSSTADRVGGGKGGKVKNTIDNPEKKAIEYLMLREDKLVNELNCSYAVLKRYYEKLKTHGLSKSDIMHINNIASKAPENLTPKSLQRTYNYLFWLDIAIGKLPNDKTTFLTSVRKSLTSKGKVSDKQKIAINKWLENIDGVPQLR